MYRLATRGVIRIADNALIQPSKSSPDWLAYQAWTKAGNTPEPMQPELEPLAGILARVHSRIDQERTRRHDLPIMYNDALFDADKDSRENITGTLSRLVRGDGLPAMWVGWRANDNSMHWSADDAADVLEQLRALSTAIEDRKQALFITAWVKKQQTAALAAAEDRAGLLAYDVTAGWP